MPRLASFAALTTAIAITGCSGRVAHEHSEPEGSSTTTVEIAPLDSLPQVPAEGCRDPRPHLVDQEGIGNVINFGDLEHHHHLHFHEAPVPPSVLVDVRVEVDVGDDRDRRRRMVEQRLTELLERR